MPSAKTIFKFGTRVIGPKSRKTSRAAARYPNLITSARVKKSQLTKNHTAKMVKKLNIKYQPKQLLKEWKLERSAKEQQLAKEEQSAKKEQLAKDFEMAKLAAAHDNRATVKERDLEFIRIMRESFSRPLF